MSGAFQRLLKQVTPLFVAAIVQGKRHTSIAFSDNYQSWQEATQHSTGYGSREILDKVRHSALKAKLGEAACRKGFRCF